MNADHSDVLISMNHLGRLLMAQGKISEAAPYCREALEKYRRVLGDEHPDTLVSIATMGRVLGEQGQPQAVIGLLAPAERAESRKFTGDHDLRLARFLTALGRARVATADFGAAEANLREAHTIVSQTKTASTMEQNAVLSGLVELYEARHAADPQAGHDTRAAEWRAQLSKLQAAPPAAGQPTTGCHTGPCQPLNLPSAKENVKNLHAPSPACGSSGWKPGHK